MRPPRFVALAEQHIYPGRLLVVFQKADFRVVDLCRKGKLFLRQFRCHSCLSEFIAQHSGRVLQNEKRVCRLWSTSLGQSTSDRGSTEIRHPLVGCHL